MNQQHPAVLTEIYTVEDLTKDYYRKTKGHWFDKDTMRFFASRLSDTLIYYPDGSRILFVSSELGPNQPKRRYSIREYTVATGAIETVGLGFQAYNTLAAAKRAAQCLVKRETEKSGTGSP